MFALLGRNALVAMVFQYDRVGLPSQKTFKRRIVDHNATIGANLTDLREGTPPPRFREHPLSKAGLHISTVHAIASGEGRRHLKPVTDEAGEVIDLHKDVQHETRRLRDRPTGLRQIDWLPEPRKTTDSKRCFEWTHRPTGYENMDQYEDVPCPGVKPSHPVSPVGVVTLGGKRGFPDSSYPSTGLPPPFLPKAPDGAEWGGWGAKGEPGRKIHDRPWEVSNEDGTDEARVIIGDMRKKKFAQKHEDTSHLTNWHWDAQGDIPPVKQKQIHHNEILTARRGSDHSKYDGLRMPLAGKPNGVTAEGSRLSFYDTVRSVEAECRGPFTAR